MFSPKEVLSAMAADFRKRNLSYAEVADLTGYKMQTIANIIASRKDYLTLGQATRFSRAFGYNMDFLTSGKGRLSRDDDSLYFSGEERRFNDDSRKLVTLMGMLNRYLYVVDDPALLALYRNMLELINETDRNKAQEYIKKQERIFDMISNNGAVAPESTENG